MKPSVSILIPAFNAEDFIADSIRSAMDQTWEPKEVIVVDDGSTDRTLEIAQQFEPQGVRVFTQRNQGAAATRNAAFSRSHGDFIQWLDADDLLAPDKIARQMENRQGPRTLLSAAFGRFRYRVRRTQSLPTALWCDLSPKEWLLRKMEQNLSMQTATWLVSRELTLAAGPWDTTLLGDDDGEYFCRVLLASDGIRFVPESKVFYRITPNSLSKIGKSNRKMEAQWHSMKLHVGYLRSLDDSPRARSACVAYLQSWLLNFYPERLDLAAEAAQLAKTLGGELHEPRLTWKFLWIAQIFGWPFATRLRCYLSPLKSSLDQLWDKLLFNVEQCANFRRLVKLNVELEAGSKRIFRAGADQ